MTQFRPVGHIGQSKPRDQRFRATYSGPPPAPKAPDRTGRCSGKDDTCNAYAVKGGVLCVGHQRSEDMKAGVADEEG